VHDDIYEGQYESKASNFSSLKCGTGRVSCLTHQIATLFISTRIISAPVSARHSIQQQCKMANAVDIHTKQRVVVIEFITAEVSSPIWIHRCLKSVCGEDATNGSLIIRWVHSFESSDKYTGDGPHRGQPGTATMMNTKTIFMH
jgi:hypothetical protein